MNLSCLNPLRHFKGRHHKRFINDCQPLVAKIKQAESTFEGLQHEQLVAMTQKLKDRYTQGEPLDKLLPEAFALVKTAAKQLCGTQLVVCGQQVTWDMVHYDVQLIGGIALHQGKIAQMATGEGKTLVATLPLYLNALSGRNCQLVTVNDYLARRDAEWMGTLLRHLGLSVGCLQHGMDSAQRRQAYACDVTYGTASEFGFDYLRDNGMAHSREEQVQRDHYYCIIDEVDSVLIDEARTPLIISGEVEGNHEGPFYTLRKDIDRLVGLQEKLCNRLFQEGKTALEQNPSKDNTEALIKLLQVRMGYPKHKQLMRLLENGSYRRLLEKFDLELSSELNREQRHAIKEGLYFAIDERNNQTDLCEKGRQVLRPNDAGAFVLPDLPLIFSDIDKQDVSIDKKQKAKLQAEDAFIRISEEIHTIQQLLRAFCLYEKDIHYVIQDGKVVIIDEHTGRAMPGRRWSDGLHQAIECKENLAIERETKTYATITLQNYFRMYERLSGMTGTAETEASEFYDIYRLPVVVIPTHKPCIRKDLNDLIFKTRREKYNAALAAIQEAHQRGQPVLVGTTSIEASEVVSKLLKRAQVPHTVLNAKYHQQEAEIVARAGQRGAVTVATNMAGRGTDIKLGDGVGALGGLMVLGTERHEAARIDLQLRGRCSRQGDPGLCRFFVSLEDDLMRLFTNANLIGRLVQNAFQEGEPMEHPLLNKALRNAQKKVEEQNFAIRKRLLQYDDVLDKQRSVIYAVRNEALRTDNPKELLLSIVDEEIHVRMDNNPVSGFRGTFQAGELDPYFFWFNSTFPFGIQQKDFQQWTFGEIAPRLTQMVRRAYDEKERYEDPEGLRGLERFLIIHFFDKHWQDHLTEMEDLRKSISLRGYGQKDPLNEYKNEAYTLFDGMVRRAREDICRNLFRSATSTQALQKMLESLSNRVYESGPEGEAATPKAHPTESLPNGPGLVPVQRGVKVGRNDPCPCGSTKKFKKCCSQEEND